MKRKGTIRSTIRRIQTTDFKKNDPMNNTKLSTFYEGNGSARAEDLYSAPDFTEAQ